MKTRAAAIVVLVGTLTLAGTASAARPLETAVVDPDLFHSSASERAFVRVRAAGATKVRVVLDWREVAPAGPRKPPNFVQSDHEDPAYDWEAADRQVVGARTAGLEAFLTIQNAPEWAEVDVGVTARPPNPVEFGRFAAAAARRYSGAWRDLPRVRYWQVWNEPNLSTYFRPQFVNGQPFSPGWYRRMVNSVAAGVKSVHGDNSVVAGGTAPFRDMTPEVQQVNPRWGPLTFMRELLCLDARLRRKCGERVRFDIWAHHPYTTGGPSRRAVLADDVSLGNLGDVRRVLQAGVRVGNVVSRGAPRLWVTEFSWDSNPPDRYGVPARLHVRWTAEALYRMWTHGVSLVTWFLLRDEPSTSFAQSGLYFRGRTLAADRPKPSLQAFRFPFVAFPQGARRVYVWGRTPAGRQARVLVEQQFRGGWKRLGVVQTNRSGVFQARYATHRTGFVRARTLDRVERAVPFSLARPSDPRFYPFGEYPFPR